ncbi:3'(2'),5'-bisphosphate nucleotidase [Fusarium oxysporum f. sp. albedinis]|nr:3'(2'),5'-bisphosphate nucleotidase [Fusarium oxysporum f. sp. albedinis]
MPILFAPSPGPSGFHFPFPRPNRPRFPPWHSPFTADIVPRTLTTVHTNLMSELAGGVFGSLISLQTWGLSIALPSESGDRLLSIQFPSQRILNSVQTAERSITIPKGERDLLVFSM